MPRESRNTLRHARIVNRPTPSSAADDTLTENEPWTPPAPTSDSDSLALWFSEIAMGDTATVGGKAASLGEMYQ